MSKLVTQSFVTFQ